MLLPGRRPYTQEDVDSYKKAKTQLDLGDWMRSSEIASFFFKQGFALPDQDDSIVLVDALDYQDVKLKIVQQEGYDAHDFNLFDDRSSVLWRKPYIDDAVRELTRSFSPAATHIYRARARRTGPAGQSFPPVMAARCLPSVRLSVFFSPRSACSGIPHQSPQSAVPQCGIPHPWSALNRNSALIPHPASYSGQVIGSRSGSGSLRSVVRTACSREHGKKLQRSRFCRPLYIVSQVRSSVSLYLLD
jgi:hypothetical protein